MLSNQWSKKLWSNLATVNTWYVFWNILWVTSTLNIGTCVQKTNMKNEKLITLITYTFDVEDIMALWLVSWTPGWEVHI